MSSRMWKIAAVCAGVLAAGACAAESPGVSAEWISSAGPQTSSTPDAPATSAPARLAEITSACKLLPANVVKDILGGTSSTKLTAREDPVEHLDEGRVRWGCTYGQGGKKPFGLVVSMRPNRAADAAAAIEAIGEASGTKTTPITGVGAGGVGYVTDGLRLVAVAVTYEDQLRLVIFSAPQVVPHAKLVEVASHVVAQV
jgi:hypothetical protein